MGDQAWAFPLPQIPNIYPRLVAISEPGILDICQILESCQCLLLFADILQSRFHHLLFLDLILCRQIHAKSYQNHNLYAVRDQDGDDARSIGRSLGGDEGKRSDDVTYAVGNKETGIDDGSLGAAGRVGNEERHADGK
jgi:hypothetical protein